MLKKTTSWWGSVVFSDEKKFNLDGPDGLAYHRAGKAFDQRYFSKRRQGGAGVMIWGGFSARGTTAAVHVRGKMDSLKYCTVLTKSLLPFVNEHHPGGYTFQQDNASIHKSQVTEEYLFNEAIDVLPWPAVSIDLKPIENV